MLRYPLVLLFFLFLFFGGWGERGCFPPVFFCHFFYSVMTSCLFYKFTAFKKVFAKSNSVTEFLRDISTEKATKFCKFFGGPCRLTPETLHVTPTQNCRTPGVVGGGFSVRMATSSRSSSALSPETAIIY